MSTSFRYAMLKFIGTRLTICRTRFYFVCSVKKPEIVNVYVLSINNLYSGTLHAFFLRFFVVRFLFIQITAAFVSDDSNTQLLRTSQKSLDTCIVVFEKKVHD